MRTAANRFVGYSIRTERWRYTEWDGGTRGTELYDEEADPAERRNLARDHGHAAVLSELRRQMQALIQTGQSTSAAR